MSHIEDTQKPPKDSWWEFTKDLAEALGDCGDADVWSLACEFVDRAQDIAGVKR